MTEKNGRAKGDGRVRKGERRKVKSGTRVVPNICGLSSTSVECKSIIPVWCKLLLFKTKIIL